MIAEPAGPAQPATRPECKPDENSNPKPCIESPLPVAGGRPFAFGNKMKLRFQYKLTKEDYLTLAKITCRNQYTVAARRNAWIGISWLFLLVAGALASYLSEILVLQILFLGAAAGHMYDLIQFKRRFWDAVSRNLVVPRDAIILDVSEEGLREQSDGIESFAPWSIVTQVIDRNEHLFIELASRLWAILPTQRLLSGGDSIEALKHLLSQNRGKAEPAGADQPATRPALEA